MTSKDGLDALDYYALLGVLEGASLDDVRRAFHRFALRHHPDRHAGETAEDVERASRIYRRGAEAYRVLGDLALRAQYDAQRKQGKTRFDATQVEERRTPTPSGGLVVRSPKARPFVTKAEQALKTGDLKTAKLNFQLALQHEPDNDVLRARLSGVEAKLKG